MLFFGAIYNTRRIVYTPISFVQREHVVERDQSWFFFKQKKIVRVKCEMNGIVLLCILILFFLKIVESWYTQVSRYFCKSLIFFISMFQFIFRSVDACVFFFSCMHFGVDKRIRHWMINRKYALYSVWIYCDPIKESKPVIFFSIKGYWKTYFHTLIHWVSEDFSWIKITQSCTFSPSLKHHFHENKCIVKVLALPIT